MPWQLWIIAGLFAWNAVVRCLLVGKQVSGKVTQESAVIAVLSAILAIALLWTGAR